MGTTARARTQHTAHGLMPQVRVVLLEGFRASDCSSIVAHSPYLPTHALLFLPAAGLIRFLGPNPSTWNQLATITANAVRGSNMILLSKVNGMKAGMWLSFSMDAAVASDTDAALDYDLVSRTRCAYSGCISAGAGGIMR